MSASLRLDSLPLARFPCRRPAKAFTTLPLGVAVMLGGGAAGCRRAPSPQYAAADASVRGAPAAGASSSGRSWSRSRGPGAAAFACRAIAVDGNVLVQPNEPTASDGGEARLSALDMVPDGAWLSLADAARVVLKDPRTLRETTFVGPARVRGCVNRHGESWIGAGRFESTLGGGEAPGAEEWVVTPFGVFRFVTAKLNVDVTPAQATATVANGTAFVWSADDTRIELRAARAEAGAVDETDLPWQRTSDGVVRIVPTGAASPLPDVRAAIDRCAARATRAEQLARGLLRHDGGAVPNGESAAEQVRARRIARASCAVARLRLELLARSGDRERLTKSLNEAEVAWSHLPLR